MKIKDLWTICTQGMWAVQRVGLDVRSFVKDPRYFDCQFKLAAIKLVFRPYKHISSEETEILRNVRDCTRVKFVP